MANFQQSGLDIASQLSCGLSLDRSAVHGVQICVFSSTRRYFANVINCGSRDRLQSTSSVQSSWTATSQYYQNTVITPVTKRIDFRIDYTGQCYHTHVVKQESTPSITHTKVMVHLKNQFKKMFKKHFHW